LQISQRKSRLPIINGMPTRQSAMSRGTERGHAIVRALVREAEMARTARGTSFAEIGRALRLSATQVANILRGKSPDVTIMRAAQLLAVVGLKLSASAFPEGEPVRDAGQLALLSRLRARIDAGLTWSEEVPVIEMPVPGAVDHRAWDAGIEGPFCRCRVDAETRVGDLQAVERRVALKQRDGREPCVLLLLADTKHHRALLDTAGEGIRTRFPVPQRAALAALKRGRSPAGNALLLL
jgi:transcriptional regulator with XRE-family HTH domain